MKRQNLQETNRVEIDFSANKTVFSPFEENNRIINTAAEILTNKFLDFVKSGGNVKNLTPDKVFGKKEIL